MTLAEHYGQPQDEKVEDVTWIADASARGWIMFMKDERIRRRPAERAAIQAGRGKCFCLANANLPALEMAKRYLDNMAAIIRASAQPGPFLYGVHANRIDKLVIDDK